ncbi:MAG: FGGY family carbohydrate kinase [Actinomycetota bacterium]|nr:FGGY family carbohydrate kinase [Actinomycetota bacterium]
MTRSRAAVGVDLGTGSVKVALVDEQGNVLAKAARPYDLSSPHAGWAETDPLLWLEATEQAAAEIADQLPGAEGVGFSGQMHGVVVCDANLEPLRPAITWADTRSAHEAAAMQVDLGDEVLARLGSPAVSGFAATSLKWLANHEPEVLAKARFALQPKDWLRARLGGAVVTEPSDASGTLLADVATGTWDNDAITWLGIDRKLLPPIVGSGDAAGELTIAGHTLPCVAGAADTAAAIAGMGLSINEGFSAVGSGSQTVSVLAEPSGGIARGTHLFATAGAPGSGWYRIGAVQNAGIALRRALEWFGASPKEANDALDAGVRPSDPIFVPYVAGERTPFVDAHLRGAWLGLGLDTDRQALLRSIVEGVAQAVALGMQAVQDAGAQLPDPLPLIGGGAVDPRFQQLIADVAQRRLAPTEQPDAAVVGAAHLALGMSDRRPASVGAIVEPRPESAELFANRRDHLVEYVRMQLDREG